MPSDKQFQDYRDEQNRMIEQHGHVVQGVLDNPPFTYTIGLAEKLGHELIVFAIAPNIAMHILNAIADTMKASPTPLPLDTILPSQGEQHPTSINTWATASVLLKECNHPDLFEKYATGAARHAGHAVRVVQVVVPDRDGKFPQDAGYDPVLAAAQPLLYAHH